jgi:hypothetical protein
MTFGPFSARWVHNATIVVAVASGAVAAIGGPQPVGATPMSVVLVVASVAAVCFLGAAAGRAFLAWMVLIAGVSSLWLPGIVIGTVVFAAVSFPSHAARRLPALPPDAPTAPVLHAALAGVAVNLSARSELDGFLGDSTLVAVAICCAIAVGGLARRGRTALRASILVSAGLVVVAIGATVTFGLAGRAAADDLRAGESLLRDGMQLLGDADLDGARTAFEEANQRLAEADDRLSSPVVVAAAAVPVVAQHRDAVRTISSEAAVLTRQISELLADLGPDSLAVVDAKVDLDAVTTFAAALEEVRLSMVRVDSEIERVSVDWLVSPLKERLDELGAEISEQRSRADMAIDIVDRLPALLGADERRTYLVMFTTPAEARGLGGFAGNWAEITIDDGRVTLSGFGRSDDLDGAAPAGVRTVSGPFDWLERYGVYGFDTEPGGRVGSNPFKNVTMSPLMSSTGRVIADLYPQSGGREVDGVFVADVYALAVLLEFTGAVEVPGADVRLDADNAVEFLLNTQYALSDKDERIDLIEDISRTVVDRLLGGTRLEPAELLRSLGPPVEQGRLAGWASRPDEQSLLERTGLAGSLLPRSTDDAVTVAFNNAAGSKIDYYLEASGRYEATIDAAGVVDGHFEITLENRSPTEGQPSYVIGNLVGLPSGTNRTYLSIFTALPASDLTIDGVAATGAPAVEGGYFVTSTLVLIPPGEQRTVRVRISGSFDAADGYSLLVRSPPAAGSIPIDVELAVVDGDGSSTVERTIETAGAERIDVTFQASGGS